MVLEKLLVEDYAAEGKCLARVEGKVIFIPNVVPGDVVDIVLLKNKKDWAEGKVLQFHSYSEERVKPFCQHFGVCGGCQWQMLPYEKQLEYKQRQVKDSLERIGKIDLPEMRAILGADQTRYYRNKLEYTFGTSEFLPVNEFIQQREKLDEGEKKPQAAVLGFHARGFFDKIVDIRTCYLQEEPTNALRLSIREFAIANGYPFYDIRKHSGFLRTLQVRICTTGEIMVNIVFAEDDKKRIKALLKEVHDKFPLITTLLYTINTKRNDSLHDLEPVTFHGNGYIIETLENFQFKIGPKSFFQTNTIQGERLYQVAREFAGLTGNETVYDLYCGTGSIGIFLSSQAKKIIGVELIPEAISDAKENAALNKLEQKTSFHAGDVIEICNDEFFALHGQPDVIITDPPRAGMHAGLVRKILDIAAPAVVYVSCNPATQARDLALLGEKYDVTAIQPVDMFPHTLHIENVVQLKLKQ
jgi:23S rRNA (uracil1939-C5)-methyltransferase